MADKTEKATPKKLKEARDKGQVAKSMDLAGASILLAGTFALGSFGAGIVTSLKEFLRTGLEAGARIDQLGDAGLARGMQEAAQVAMKAVLPVAVVCALTAIVIMAAQVKLKLTPQALKPDFKRMSPISNAKQILGINALVELLKNLAKLGAVMAVVAAVLLPMKEDLGTLVGMKPQALAGLLVTEIAKVARAAALAYFVIGIADFVWQKHRLDKSLKMDKQEVKDEHKQAELPPEVRGAIRRRQMMAARARMMAAVPEADVVVTNPTHYAVALKYSPDHPAPQVIAKGMDLVAFKIREAASDAGVPVIPDPPLARALHAAVEVGDTIPEELYEAVAQVLAFVYRTASQRIAA
ncbi:MAG: flagellar biosynthesis protein FlhB [Patulibacter sp.]